MKTIEQNVSDDTSTCYQDCTLNTNEDFMETESSACKKRKVHIHEKTQEDIIKEKDIIWHNNAATNECKTIPRNKQQEINQTYNQQHYRDALAITTHIQSPNLSDSDSNDAFPVPVSSNINMSVYVFDIIACECLFTLLSNS